MWVNVLFFGMDKNGDGPLKAWTSHKRRCVFVVHNSAYYVALVAVGAALVRGRHRSTCETAACMQFQAVVQMGFLTPNLEIML